MFAIKTAIKLMGRPTADRALALSFSLFKEVKAEIKYIGAYGQSLPWNL